MLPLTPTKPRTEQNRRGFSLVEVMMGMFVISLVFAGVMTGLVAAMRVNKAAADQIAAVQLAQDTISRWRSRVWTDIPGSGWNVLQPDGNWMVSATGAWTTVDIPCAEFSNNQKTNFYVLVEASQPVSSVKQLRVTVVWSRDHPKGTLSADQVRFGDTTQVLHRKFLLTQITNGGMHGTNF